MPDNHSSEATAYRQKHRRYVDPQAFRQRVKYVRAGIEALQHLFINNDQWIANSEQHLISVSFGRGNPSQSFTYRQLAVYLKDNFADTVATFAEVSQNYEDDGWFERANDMQRDSIYRVYRALENRFKKEFAYNKLISANIDAIARHINLAAPYHQLSALQVTKAIYQFIHGEPLEYVVRDYKPRLRDLKAGRSTASHSAQPPPEDSTAAAARLFEVMGEVESSGSEDEDGAGSVRSRSHSVGHSLAHGAHSARRGGLEQGYGRSSVYFPMSRTGRW